MTVDLDDIARFLRKKVRINRGGPDSIEGVLIDVNEDYLTIESKKETIFVASAHIKSITTGAKPIRSNFIELLQHLKYQRVQINRGGPEKVVGVILDVTDQYVKLKSREGMIHISIFHIRSLTKLASPKSSRAEIVKRTRK